MLCSIRKIAIFCFSFLIFFPVVVSAKCEVEGSTVVFVNGINTTLRKAQNDLADLANEYRDRTNDRSVEFLTGYNPSHLEGAGDILKVWFQNKNTSGQYIEDYDLKTILLNLHNDLNTRRILLVGHSQGSYYTNAMYNYLLSHGVPREAAAVYNVATPASFVEGNGKYLNSSGDMLLAYVKTLGFTPLKNNIQLDVSDPLATYPGHSFSGEYLANAPNRVVGDIRSLVSTLEPAMASATGECFTAPDSGLVYKTAGAAFTVGDTLASAVKKGAAATVTGAKYAAVAVSKVATNIQSALADDRGVSSAGDTNSENSNKYYSIVDRLYGSNFDNEELRDLLGERGGGAVVTAPVVAPVVAGMQIEEYDPAPPRKYVTRSRGDSSSDEPESEVEEVVVNTPEPIIEIEESEVEEVASTTDEVATATEDVPATPVFIGVSPLEETFDAFSTTTWHGFGRNGKQFTATTTDCVAGGCVEANGDTTFIPRMYATGEVKESGAFTIYMRARNISFDTPIARVSICVTGSQCVTERLDFSKELLVDDTWHQYLIAWRQGSATIEACILRDTIDHTNCSWFATPLPTGTTFDSVAVWSTNSIRADLGLTLWFDELRSYTP
ncbi:hypothetical protein IT396_03250 [Candidatus Nomurabacteria bacterium]|nr:hypothetical protein [Candidatus Nomurabacteria bacterium]